MQRLKWIFLWIFVGGSFVFARENSTQNTNNKDDSSRFEISKQLDIFNALVKELEIFYVDTIDMQAAVRRGIDAMLSRLDPYTEYIPEDEMEDLKLITTGEYGGIGAVIRYRDGATIIYDPYEGMPAALAGLKPGDKILSVDDTDATKLSSDRVSEMLKGLPNTELKLKIQRPGEKKPRTFEIMRKQIIMDQVTYYGVKDDSIGYIYLQGFTDKSAEEIKNAFEDLRKNHAITSLILDLRDNGGGVLEGAVQTVGYFVPKGTEVISLKGKADQPERIYRTYNEPVDSLIPLAVLINGGSASASEIVSGALQDMDRAVLVGQRSFGKGLVQSPRDLPYGGKLKVTISKYYIPSGRCIQQLDYTHRNPDGSVAAIPDSLTSVFYTTKGRPVRDGGGIRPDVEVEEEKLPTMLYYLDNDRDFVVFDYVNDWVTKHQTIPSPDLFAYSDEDYEDFKKIAVEKKFEYDRQSEKMLGTLKEVANFEGFLAEDSTVFATLEDKLKPDLERDLDRYKPEIKRLVASEIVKRYYYLRGQIQYSLRNDKTLEKAMEVLKDRELYAKTLSPAEE
ncbi:MAG: S41 family peptidase [Tannerella sp.]|jgi:carboxyl-terminal processing protease|nr:S41 family peptidase [Tannerella sp.]